MKRRTVWSSLSAASALLAVLTLVGCVAGMAPQVTFQGRLTDPAGAPLNGNRNLTFRLFSRSTGGTAIYSETDSVSINNGFFETVVGPSASGSGLTPEILSGPLYLEVAVAGETLSPRQRLYGAPYAFTIMPGAVVSQTLTTSVGAPYGVTALFTVRNNAKTSGTDLALPTIRLIGVRSLQLDGLPGVNNDGSIYSDPGDTTSDLALYSNDYVMVDLDEDNNDTSSFFRVRNGANASACSIYENGNLTCTGTKSAVVDVAGQSRLMYAMESPEVRFEDFGTNKLAGGAAQVTIDPLFARTVNLAAGYQVFLTPLGDCNGLWVGDKTEAGFAVRELGGGTSGVGFDYRIVAKRAGYENLRLPVDTSQADEQAQAEAEAASTAAAAQAEAAERARLEAERARAVKEAEGGAKALNGEMQP